MRSSPRTALTIPNELKKQVKTLTFCFISWCASLGQHREGGSILSGSIGSTLEIELLSPIPALAEVLPFRPVKRDNKDKPQLIEPRYWGKTSPGSCPTSCCFGVARIGNRLPLGRRGCQSTTILAHNPCKVNCFTKSIALSSSLKIPT